MGNNDWTHHGYGVLETNPMNEEQRNEARGNGIGYLDIIDRKFVLFHIEGHEDGLAVKQFERVRYVTDPGYPVYDFSYGYARCVDGKLYQFQMGCYNDKHDCYFLAHLPKRLWEKKGIYTKSLDMVAIYEWARKEGVYLKGYGFFENLSLLT